MEGRQNTTSFEGQGHTMGQSKEWPDMAGRDFDETEEVPPARLSGLSLGERSYLRRVKPNFDETEELPPRELPLPHERAHQLLIVLRAQTWRELREAASKRGTGPRELAQCLIVEGLASPPARLGGPEAGQGINKHQGG